MNGPTRSPVFQIHPSLRCNLSCAHCYSSSSPWANATLDATLVRQAIADAAELGYRTVSVSGGEPLLYPALAEILAFAKDLGLRTTVTTNGTLLEGRRLDAPASVIDLLAISLDGDAVTHNALRGTADAHARLLRGLANVQRRNMPFGFIHTLTRQSWEHVEAIVAFAAGADAKLVQIHPLEAAGRAGDQLRHDACDQFTLAQVYVLALALNVQYAGNPFVQYDVLHTARLLDAPQTVYADADGAPQRSSPSAEDLAVLVLEADGTVVPMTFGFGRAYRVADLRRERLRDAWPRFARDVYPGFRALCRRVHTVLTAGAPQRFVNWYETLQHYSLAALDQPGTQSALVRA